MIKRCGMLLWALAAAPWPAYAQVDTAAAAQPPHGDRLQPGDFIVLNIWREPDLSDTIQVGVDGQATFPKLGRMQVTGMSPDSLTDKLVSEYARSLRNPSVEIKVLRRITISGAVRNPSLYPVDATLTVADAVALAGGASPEGKIDEVQLRRSGQIQRIKLDGSTRLMDSPIRSGDQLYVPQRSWGSRNLGVLIGLVGAAASVVFVLAD